MFSGIPNRLAARPCQMIRSCDDDDDDDDD
jgi:hypothetical protein